MRVEDFTADQQKHLTRTLSGGHAFVPPPLPPKLDAGQIAHRLGATASAVGELRGAARRLVNPYMLIRPLIQKEALTSSAIEGTITTIEGIVFEEAAPQALVDENAREAANYIRAVQHAVQQLQTYPISHRVIMGAHKVLLAGLSPSRGQGKRPGEYKNSQNAIGQAGDNELTARYVPSPPAQTERCMDELEAFINRQNRNQGEELVDIAIAHYQFEAIHPFLDGNGRMGRMLVTLMAQQLRLMDLPLLHISAQVERQKEQYIELLYRVSTQGAWESWIEYFLGIVESSCVAATDKVDQIIKLEKELKARARKARKYHRLNTLIEALFERNWITAPEAQKVCGTHFQTAQSDLVELVKLNVLKVAFEGRPVVYFAPEIAALSNR